MKKVKPYLLSFAAALLVTAIIALGALQRPDKWIQDRLYQQGGVPSGDIIIIGIDEEALDALGPYNTWDRNVMAAALEALAADPENKPAVTAVDVLYSGESSPEADERLAKAAENLGNVVAASLAEYGQRVVWENGHAVSMNTSAIINFEQPYEALKSATVQGHINAMSDLDGVLRHALLYVQPDGAAGGKVYSMASQTAKLYLEKHGESLQLPPVNAAGHFYVPFTAKPDSYYDGISIAWLINGMVPSGYWADKIVLIGPYATGLQDAYFTSIDKGQQMYGVEFQANVIQSLLEKNFKTEVGDIPQLIALFLICLAASILFQRWKALWGGVLCLGLIILGLGAPILLYRWGYVLHVLWLPVCAAALYILSIALHYAQAAKERRALALENERIGTELAMAARIQANSLPKEFPPFPDRKEFDIYASMTPAKKVGGDLYDFFLIDDDHLGLVIGDVSGKGVPASLFMMVATSLIRNAAMAEISPAKALTTVNAQICARNPEEMFVTVWLGVLEISTGKLTAASAGHEYPALKAPDGHFELIKDKHGFVIGGMEGIRYREYTLQMDPGAKLFVYTDGVAEATNSSEELFGTERMIDALREAEECNPQTIIESVKASVDAFVGPAPQFDDLTVLCVEYHGNNARMDQKEKEPDAAENP